MRSHETTSISISRNNVPHDIYEYTNEEGHENVRWNKIPSYKRCINSYDRLTTEIKSLAA